MRHRVEVNKEIQCEEERGNVIKQWMNLHEWQAVTVEGVKEEVEHVWSEEAPAAWEIIKKADAIKG